MDIPNLEPRFVDFWSRARLKGDASPVYRNWADRYSEPTRGYHTLKHIEEGLDILTDPDVRAQCDNPLLVEAAWWPHDLVYKAGKTIDANEAQSAVEALLVYSNAGLPQELAYNRVLWLVMATRHSITIDREDTDAKVIRDIDLSILGQSPERYREYVQGVRKEWVDSGAVSLEEFRAGRANFLREFLDQRKGSIYNLPLFRKRYEPSAFKNIRHELHVLDSGDVL